MSAFLFLWAVLSEINDLISFDFAKLSTLRLCEHLVLFGVLSFHPPTCMLQILVMQA